MRFFICLLICLSTATATASEPAKTLLEEFARLKEFVQSNQPDGEVGGYMEYIQMDGYIVLYKPDNTEDHDVIRIFANREFPDPDFAVTYFLSDHLYKDRRVLRRFVGHEPSFWRNDTVDVNTGEYLGRQGLRVPRLNEDEQAILDYFEITLF